LFVMVSPVFPGRAVGSVSLSCGLPSNFLHEVRVVIVLNRRGIGICFWQRWGIVPSMDPKPCRCLFHITPVIPNRHHDDGWNRKWNE